MKKFIALLLVVLVVAAGIYMWKKDDKAGAEQAGGHGGPGGGGAMPPTEVTVLTIAPKTVNFTKDLPGRTSSYRVAEIRPQVNGIITKRLFEEGSEVTEGQQLYQIDPAPYQAALDSAQADIMRAKAAALAAQAKFNRNNALVKSGIVSKQTFDDLKAASDQAKADVAIAQASYASAKINLDYTKVMSPITGRVGKSLVTEGALVTAGQTSPLATVQQYDPIYVDVTQSSTELLELRRQLNVGDKMTSDAPVLLFLDNSTKPFQKTGTLQFSDVTVDQTTGAVQLRVLFPNPQHVLLPGLFVRARIEQAREENAITIPQKAIARNADGSVTVWLVGEGNKVSLQPIKVSTALGDQWLVTEGLKAGDRVIVEGVQKVGKDAVVNPVEQGQEKEAASAAAGQPPAEPPAQDPQPEQKPEAQQ